MTQFSVFNPQLDYELEVSVTFLPTGGGQGRERFIELPPNATAFSDNILADLFGITGTGSLLVATFPEDNPGVPNEVLSRAVLVTTNTYNNSRTGTYGQTIPGVWTGLLDYDSDEISAIAHGISNLDSEGWRTNVGAVNLGRCSVDVLVSVYDFDGDTILRQQRMRVPPMGHIQDRLPVQVDRGAVEFFVDDPCAADDNRYAVVFPYASTIDLLSGDPTYQTPTLLAPPSALYGKKGRVDPTALGKKIDITTARAVRGEASRLGAASLVKKGSKLQIQSQP
jgi:hypothetical protein